MVHADVGIIGAGPIGLELAVALKKAGVNYLHLEAGQIGQTVSWFPDQTRFFSSPERIALAGVPLQTADQSKATREEYLAYLRAVAQQFDLRVNTYEKVTGIDRHEADGTFTVHSARAGLPQACSVRKLVLALGDMARPRLLHVPGEDLPHVSHYFEDPHPYFRKRLLIVGGRNSAVETALRCHRAGAQVAISYRRAAFDKTLIKYWLWPEIESLIKEARIAFHPLTAPKAIAADHVALRQVETGQVANIRADFVLLLTGYVADTALFELLGVALVGESHTPVFNTDTMETNVPGVYVAGTAAAGTQAKFRLFIENCHAHVEKIAKALTGRPAGFPSGKDFGLPEN